MKTLGLLAVVLGLFAPAAFAASASLVAFDADVAVCRRTIREACALVQELVPQKVLDAAKRQAALDLIAKARGQWAQVSARHLMEPPEEYAKDKAFRARFGDIANSLEDMERALAAGEARRSLHACGFGCGLFVALHEDNGLVYGMDRLFALRKTAKSASAVFKSCGVAGMRAAVPTLLRQRDEVWLAPLPWPAGDRRNDDYTAGLQELSASLDRLAATAGADDVNAVGALLDGMVARINKPYGSAL